MNNLFYIVGVIVVVVFVAGFYRAPGSPGAAPETSPIVI